MFMRVSFLTGCIQHRPSERHLAAGRHDSHWHKGHRQGKSNCQARGNSMAKVSGQTQSSCSVYIRGKPGKTLGAEAPPKKKSLSHQTCTIQLSAKYKNWCVFKNIFFFQRQSWVPVPDATRHDSLSMHLAQPQQPAPRGAHRLPPALLLAEHHHVLWKASAQMCQTKTFLPFFHRVGLSLPTCPNSNWPTKQPGFGARWVQIIVFVFFFSAEKRKECFPSHAFPQLHPEQTKHKSSLFCHQRKKSLGVSVCLIMSC